ncbi:unnamed protein product [Durusdinium trenchii]|uniref:Dynein heavy chain 3 AAA+ lid domain-containing protein n=1 Tax=Durusdinium trenchii TaxID=1381693 RepID=A0ABP0JJ44_9DINO
MLPPLVASGDISPATKRELVKSSPELFLGWSCARVVGHHINSQLPYLCSGNSVEFRRFNIIDVVMVSAMGPPGGGRTFITELAYSDLSDVRRDVFDSSVQEVVPKMIDCTINVFKQAMEADGVHPNFLQDAHWAAWLAVPFERPMEETPLGDEAGIDPVMTALFTRLEGFRRVLQWNLLAEGLVPEGFMMPLVSKAHVQRSASRQQDLRTAAKLSSQGYRSFVWRQGEDGSDQIHWEEFARMACNMVLAMKGLPPSQKEERGLDLKKRYNPDQEGPNSGQLTVNEKAVVGPEHRLLRVEVDNFAFLAHELQKLGYACSSVGAKDYVPLKDRERLAQSEWSFAPKSGVKRGKSTARHFLEKRVKDGGHKATIDGHQWPIDDDGQAIFWRNDRFEIVGEPEFLVLPGDADIDAFLDGTSEEPGAGDAVQAVMGVLWESHGFERCTQSDQGAVRVLLQFKDLDERLHRQSSGTDQEVHRIQQLHHLGRSADLGSARHVDAPPGPARGYLRFGLSENWSMDANTEVDFEDPDMTCSSVPIPEDANALQSFMQKNDLRSVWDSFYSSKGDIWDPPVSVWKMRGSASAQPKKVGEETDFGFDSGDRRTCGPMLKKMDAQTVAMSQVIAATLDVWSDLWRGSLLQDMYQLIDHIFYDGRHLFGQGEQALRLREKPLEAKGRQMSLGFRVASPAWVSGTKGGPGRGKDPADRDWLALMPNELLPSDHLPIVWDFHLNVNSPRWEPTVLVSCAKQLFQQLRSLLPGADPNLDEIESLFAPLYLGGLHGRRDSSPDVALSVFHVLKKISVEAKATLKYELTDNVSKLELFRERIIKATGRHQSKATYESSLVQALLFSAASIVAGQGGLFSDQWSTIALAAMRCVLRTLTAVPCLDPSFVEVMSEGQLWALLAQMTSIITPNCPYIVKAFDQNGIVTSQDMDCLLVEIGEQLNCRRTPCAPALCVLRCINWRKCATGTHVAAAVKMLMQAIEAGKIPFLEQHLFGPTDRMEEMQAVPSAVSVVSTIRLLRANSATPQPPLPPEMQHKQTFDQSAAISALASLANSGNLDSGGGLALLLESLQRQMALAQGTSTPERQARALHRPPPWVVASYVRRTVVSALEKTEPLEALVVSAQKLHVSEQEAKKRARLNPVEELIQALVDFPQDGPQSQAHTFGRILRLLVKIADRCGPKALLAPMVARNGIDRIRDVLRCLALLSEEDLQRWKTHLHLNRFLDLLLSVDVSSDSLLLALQQRVEEAIKEKEFKELLMQRPSRDDASPKSYDLNKILAEIDTFDFVKKLPESPAMEDLFTRGEVETFDVAAWQGNSFGASPPLGDEPCALNDLLPTPAKSHYLFNLRDIWKVFLGLCSLSAKKSNNVPTVTRCWAHEIQRVFGDRLTDEQDLQWMKTQVDTAVGQDLAQDLGSIFDKDQSVTAQVAANVSFYLLGFGAGSYCL